MGPLTYGWEPADVFLFDAGLLDMMRELHEEMAHFSEDNPMDPDFARMKRLEDEGLFKFWVARTEEGGLAGWIEFHLSTHMHSRRTRWAFDCGHYLAPRFRDTGWNWIRMWRAAMEALREMDCKMIAAHDNSHRPLGVMFRRLGFVETGALYARRL